MNKCLAGILFLGMTLLPSEKNIERKITQEIPELRDNHWGREELIRRGVGEEVVNSIGLDDAKRIAINFKYCYVPGEWVKEISLTPWEYTSKKIRKDEYWQENRDELIKDIEKKLMKNKHIYREDTHFKENIDSISDVRDKKTLVIIKKYYDFFEDKKNSKELKKLFEEGQESDEKIGIIRYDGEDFEFYPIETSWENPLYDINPAKNSKNSVASPGVVPYIHYIGTLHTHTITKNDNMREVAGPSPADIRSLKRNSMRNPLQVDAVITLINDKEFNADIYLGDVYNVGGVPKTTPYVYVYDLGIFDF